MLADHSPGCKPWPRNKGRWKILSSTNEPAHHDKYPIGQTPKAKLYPLSTCLVLHVIHLPSQTILECCEVLCQSSSHLIISHQFTLSCLLSVGTVIPSTSSKPWGVTPAAKIQNTSALHVWAKKSVDTDHPLLCISQRPSSLGQSCTHRPELGDLQPHRNPLGSTRQRKTHTHQ